MLLNVIQRPDGTLDAEVEHLLSDITAWMAVHGEAIHSTRPWAIHGEGRTQTVEGHFKEDFAFSAEDIRFTQSKDARTLYAIALGVPASGEIRIRSLGRSPGGGNRIDRGELMGHSGNLPIEQTAEAIIVKLPSQTASKNACTLRIYGPNLRPSTTAQFITCSTHFGSTGRNPHSPSPISLGSGVGHC